MVKSEPTLSKALKPLFNGNYKRVDLYKVLEEQKKTSAKQRIKTAGR